MDSTLAIYIAFVVLFLLVVLILIKLFSSRLPDISHQMLDLKNELNELKTKQLESQGRTY